MADADRALYVHVGQDAAVFVIAGWDPRSRWVSADELKSLLTECKARGGTILYTRDDPQGTPPADVLAVFEHIASFELPIRFADEPHPDTARQ